MVETRAPRECRSLGQSRRRRRTGKSPRERRSDRGRSGGSDTSTGPEVSIGVGSPQDHRERAPHEEPSECLDRQPEPSIRMIEGRQDEEDEPARPRDGPSRSSISWSRVRSSTTRRMTKARPSNSVAQITARNPTGSKVRRSRRSSCGIGPVSPHPRPHGRHNAARARSHATPAARALACESWTWR